MGTYTRAAASLSLLGTVLVASCGPVALPWKQGDVRHETLPAPSGAGAVTGQASAPVLPGVPAPAAPPAPGRPVVAPAIVNPVDLPPLRLEIEASAPDSALTVPALARPNLPPRAPWQAPEAPRVAFPDRIERWRPLVRHVMAEEWQYGTLDGHAARLDDDMVLAMMQQESAGNPKAKSYVGAQGLMQVMPQTFAIMMAGKASLAPAIDPDAFWDESSNIRAGIRYMALAMQNHDGNFYWSLASYNAGIGTVKRWRLAGLYAVPPVGGYTETAHYTQVIMRNYRRARPDVQLQIPDAMPDEHVPGALELIANFRAAQAAATRR